MEGSIVLKEVTKSYQNGTESLDVLHNVSLEIPGGAIVVITGESGSGKSTLLHLLGGMDKPTKGTIVVAGKDVAHSSEAQLSQYRMKTIGFIFQFHHLLKDFTALENVLMPGLLGGLDRNAAQLRAMELIERVGIKDRMHAYPTELSGGERQRAAVARAVMNDPGVLLADEPTGSLDEFHSREVEQLLFGLSRDLGKTLVLVTHNNRLARDGDIHLHLTRGRVEWIFGPNGADSSAFPEKV